MKREYQRKIFHMVLGITIGLLILYIRKRYLVFIVTGTLCTGLVIRLLLLKGYSFKLIENFLNRFGRPMEVGMGAMNFFIGVLIAILFPFPREYASTSVIVLGVSDGLSTMMGLGSKNKVYANKTFEGSAAFLISSFIIIYFSTTLFQAVLVSITLTVIELLSPVDDNLLIPPVGALLLSLATW
ncbi:MAG: hypothetical protein JW791_05510 [Nanoarchaeota archaeon]|nr:hypothetical protein [Nanoarchaeota archaeon]